MARRDFAESRIRLTKAMYSIRLKRGNFLNSVDFFMLRVVQTVVLVALVAMPRGICFCHYFDAPPPQNEQCCEGAEDTPTSPHAKSTHVPVHHHDGPDDECPCCKLRHLLAAEQSPLYLERDAGVSFDAIAVIGQPLDSLVSVGWQQQLAHLRVFDRSVPLIPCALRI